MTITGFRSLVSLNQIVSRYKTLIIIHIDNVLRIQYSDDDIVNIQFEMRPVEITIVTMSLS